MHSTMLSDALQTLLGDAAFALCFFFPGYLVASSCNLMGFRSRTLPEKLLWAVALSGPISTVLTCIGGRVVPPNAMLALFLAMGLATAVVLVRDARGARGPFGREFWIACLCMAVVGVYCIAATLGIQTPHSLYEGVVSVDLSVRVPLVDAATRGGVPPGNPFFAVDGHPAPMRYYYFWYVLCAQVARLTHISARACFVASSAWSAYSLLAVLFLALKYMGSLTAFAPVCRPQTPAPPLASLRRCCIVALGLACVMGLDLIAAVAGLLFHRVRLYADIEWWRPDRSPSWLGAMLSSPHHLAGVAYGTTGFMLLALLPARRRQRAVHALLAAVCFAALVGTSTYLAICFALSGALLVAIKLRRHQFAVVAVMGACAVLAVALAWPFLHELLTRTSYSTADYPKLTDQHAAISNRMFKVVIRNWHQTYGLVGFYENLCGIKPIHSPLRYLPPLFFLPVLYVMELGFYVFVLWYRFKADFFGPKKDGHLRERTLWLWALFLGFALPGVLLSSVPTQGINDLGMQTGLALRFVLIVWAAPMVVNTYRQLRSGSQPTAWGRWAVRLTVAMLLLGLGGEAWQIILDRIYMPLAAHRKINPRLWFVQDDMHLHVREAYASIAANLPADALVQTYPEAKFGPVYRLYLNRQMAAGDESCESPFGGDASQCRNEILPPLYALFGRMRKDQLGQGEQQPELPDPAKMTDAAFRRTCAQLHLSALLVANDSPAWSIPGTWVWTEPTLYADDSVRVLKCPR